MKEVTSRELVLDIGIADDNFEYGETGDITFKIPYYTVKVNLSRGKDKTIAPCFGYQVIEKYDA